MPAAPPPSASWRERDDQIEIRVGDRAVVALLPVQRRVRVGLVMPVVDRVVDISVQPAAACAALTEAARRTRAPMSTVEATARRALGEAADISGARPPGPGATLAAVFGGMSFPLLAAAYDLGAEALDEVPRWAEPVLSATTVAEAASVAFGDRATRPVRRALVEAIRALPSGRIDLAALALGLMARDVLEPDRLARVLVGKRVAHPSALLPDPSDLRRGRRVLEGWGPARVESVLLEALATAGAMRLLLDTLRYANQLGDHGPPHPLPSRLAELHDVHRALMRSAGGPTFQPRARRAATPPRPAVAAPHLPHAPLPHPILPTPEIRGGARPDTPIVPPPSVRALDGRGVGDLDFVLPRTAGDLDRWGRLLSNCLGDFGTAAATGRSVMVGVLRANRLTYVVELTPAGAIRQFCGHANRRPRDADRRAVVRALLSAGVLDHQLRSNRFWLAGLETDTEDRAS